MKPPLAPSLSVVLDGFLIADGLLVTAWHCVREPLKPGQRYVVCRKRGPDVYDPFPLDDIVPHPAGRDLALGRVPLAATQRFSLFRTAVQPGMHVWTFGYPAPHSFDTTIMATGCSRWGLDTSRVT
jgi:hypothetical protein